MLMKQHITKLIALALLAVVALAACGPNIDFDQVPFEDIPADAEVMRDDSGVVIILLEEGDGMNPVIGDTVRVHYTGRLADGTEFDSSLGEDRGEPIEFRLGFGEVIEGWDEGVNELNEGSRAILVIPSELGYGEVGTANIPPNAPLYFEVELVEVTR